MIAGDSSGNKLCTWMTSGPSDRTSLRSLRRADGDHTARGPKSACPTRPSGGIGDHSVTSCSRSRSSSTSSWTTRFSPDEEPVAYREWSTKIRTSSALEQDGVAPSLRRRGYGGDKLRIGRPHAGGEPDEHPQRRHLDDLDQRVVDQHGQSYSRERQERSA